MRNNFLKKMIYLLIISILILPIAYSVNNLDVTITVLSSNSRSSSSSGGNIIIGTKEIKCVKEVLETSMVVGDMLCFICEGEKNLIKLDSLRSDYVIFQINEGMERLTITLGEPEEYDLQGDGILHIRITLNTNYFGTCYLIFEKLCNSE